MVNVYANVNKLIPLTNEGVHEKALELLPAHGKVLDVAAGPGNLCIKMKEKGLDVTGCDINPSKFFKLDIVDLNKGLPYKNNMFDCVVAIEIIEHIENPYFLMREISRVLKPTGTLILSTPNIQHYLSRLRFLIKGYPSLFEPAAVNEINHIHMMTCTQQKKLFKEAGFTIVGKATNNSINKWMVLKLLLSFICENKENWDEDVLIFKLKKVRK